jgi:hypothetical protein
MVDGKSGGGPYDSSYLKVRPESQQRQVAPNGQLQPITTQPAPAPVKKDRIAMIDGSMINGQVVSDTNAPRGGIQLTFVSANRQAPEQTVTANAAGRFEVELGRGTWLIYVNSGNGQQSYHSQMDVAANQKAPIVLVSR